MQLPSVDVFIGLFFLFGVAYGFLFQREKIVTALCSVYVGIVIAETFSGSVFDFFNGNKVVGNQLWIKSNASAPTIAIVLFLATILLLTSSIKAGRSTNNGPSMIEILLYSILSVALIISSILGFLPEATRTHYLEISRVARYLFDWHTLFVLTPPIALVIINWKKK